MPKVLILTTINDNFKSSYVTASPLSFVLFSMNRVVNQASSYNATAPHLARSGQAPQCPETSKNRQKSKIFRKRRNASQVIRTHPNASERIRTGPNGSEWVRTGPNMFKHWQKLPKIDENFAKILKKFAQRGDPDLATQECSPPPFFRAG